MILDLTLEAYKISLWSNLRPLLLPPGQKYEDTLNDHLHNTSDEDEKHVKFHPYGRSLRLRGNPTHNTSGAVDELADKSDEEQDL